MRLKIYGLDDAEGIIKKNLGASTRPPISLNSLTWAMIRVDTDCSVPVFDVYTACIHSEHSTAPSPGVELRNLLEYTQARRLTGVA